MENVVRTAPDRAREPLSSAEWRGKAAGLGQRAELAVDPSRAGLSDDALGAAFAAVSQVMMRMRDVAPEERGGFFASACADLGVPSAEEAQALWRGLLAWAEAHPPRAALLAKLQQAYVEANRSWAQFEGGKLRSPLRARALFYARQSSWRASARAAAGGLTGDPRGQTAREDLFLWMGGLVEWARNPGDRPGYLTTGDLAGSLRASLRLPPGEESCLDGVLTAAGFPGPDPWDARLVRAAGLTMVSADHVLELVRRLRGTGDAEAAWRAWEAALGGAGAEVTRRPWARAVLEGTAIQLAMLLDTQAGHLRNATDLPDFEARLGTATGGALRLADFFAEADLAYAFASLRDLSRVGADTVVEQSELPPAPVVPQLAKAAGRHEPIDPDPAVVAEALTSAWHYGRRLLGRNLRLGYRVLGPLVDQHWHQLAAAFLDLVTRHPPDHPQELANLVDVLAAGGRGLEVAEALTAVLARQRNPGRWPVVLEELLGRLHDQEVRAVLPLVAGVVLERRDELHSLVPGLVRLFVRAGMLGAGLDFCLRFFGHEGEGGASSIAEAARLAHRLGDWHSAGKPVLEAARALGELVPAAWEPILELATAAERLPDALSVVLSWASRSLTPAGREKAREQLVMEWSQALDLARGIPDWFDGFGQVWTAAEDSSCPVPGVWRTLVHEARARELAWIVREGSKRFVEAWGADQDLTRGLWEMLDRAVQDGDGGEFVDLLHWLHVDLGHNRWTSEMEFSQRVLDMPGVTPRMLGEWAVRKLYSSRRWALLGAALAHDTDALDTLLDVVRETGQPISRALEGLVLGLPEERSWPFLIRLLPGPAWSLEWAWMEVLKRWKSAPETRAAEMCSLLPIMPEPHGPVTPAFERECRLFLGYLLATEPVERWAAVAQAFSRTASAVPSWHELLERLLAGAPGLLLYEVMVAELVEPLECEAALAGHARLLRERLQALARTGPPPMTSAAVAAEQDG